MENKMKKDVQLWIRGNSKGELDINKLENFTLFASKITIKWTQKEIWKQESNL